jgi:hypothetical protein
MAEDTLNPLIQKGTIEEVIVVGVVLTPPCLLMSRPTVSMRPYYG